jgi:hypothetical protein
MVSTQNRQVPFIKVLVTFAFGALLALAGALAFNLSLADREARVSAMGPLCHDMGGEFSLDLHDDNYMMRFSDKGFGNQDLEKVMRHAAPLPVPPPVWIGYSGNIWLELGHTGVDDAGLQFLTPQVTYLDLRGCAITSKGVRTIVERAPRLFTLLLDGTRIDDEALKALAPMARPRPPYGVLLLGVSHTSITAEGLRPLAGALCSVSVEGTGVSLGDLSDLKIDVHIDERR